MDDQEKYLLNRFEELLQNLRDAKPEERSEKARRYAVTITEFEKVMAYFLVYILEENQE